MGLYQDPEVESSSQTGARDMVSALVVYIDNILQMAETKEKARNHASSLTSFSMPRIHNKVREDNRSTITVPRMK